MVKRLIDKVKSRLRPNKFQKLGISRKQWAIMSADNSYRNSTVTLFERKIHITNCFWFLHSLEELFIDEVYRFDSVNKEPLIFDCGANWGLSIIYFKKLFPKCKIIAFEPDPSIFVNLERNIEEFELEDVSLINKAVWVEDSDLVFSSDGSLGGTLINSDANTKNQIIVKCVRLQQLLLQHECIDFLKIDIEGAEFEVIMDCKNDLGKVKFLFIEYHSRPTTIQNLSEILKVVTDAGFRYYIKEAWENMRHPFVAEKNLYYDLQLNIFCYKNN